MVVGRPSTPPSHSMLEDVVARIVAAIDQRIAVEASTPDDSTTTES